ncbi:MAG: hypothetical protein V3R85_01045, partial [Alphaproteobacteria bacterium]
KTLKSDWFKSGYVAPIIQFGLKRESDMPNVPLASELATTPGQKIFAEFMASTSLIGRGFMFPPNISGDKLKAFRDGFDKMVASAGLRADAKKRGAFLSPVRGVDMQATVKKAMAVDRKLIEQARKAMSVKN